MNEKWTELEETREPQTGIHEDLPPYLLEQSREVIGCAMEVLNVLGHGLLEKPYEQALVVEFSLRGIPYRQQAGFDVLYKGRAVGYFVPDLIAYDSIVIDTKTVERIGSHETGQMLNYLRITGLDVGILLNFSKPRLEWRRVAL
jgi:GxxExxY protein